MSLKLDLCNFSGMKIYPSRGIRLARVDGKIYNFVNKKSRNAYLMKKNPRKIAWTVLYRLITEYFDIIPAMESYRKITISNKLCFTMHKHADINLNMGQSSQLNRNVVIRRTVKVGGQ